MIWPEPTKQEEGSRDQHRAAYQVGLDGLLVAVTDPAPDRAGDAVGPVLEPEHEADVDGAELELPQHLRLQVDGNEAIAHCCNDEGTETEPNCRDFENSHNGQLGFLLVTEVGFLLGVVRRRHHEDAAEAEDDLQPAHHHEGEVEPRGLVQHAAHHGPEQLGHVHDAPRHGEHLGHGARELHGLVGEGASNHHRVSDGVEESNEDGENYK